MKTLELLNLSDTYGELMRSSDVADDICHLLFVKDTLLEPFFDVDIDNELYMTITRLCYPRFSL